MNEERLLPGIPGALQRGEQIVSSCAMAGLWLCVLWGVLTRYVTQSPAVWTSELSGILFTWVVFIGTLSAFRQRQHIRITGLLAWLPDIARRRVEWLADLLLFVFLGYVAWLSTEMMLLGASRYSPVLRVPFSLVYLATALSFGLMAFSALLRLLPARSDP
jgi:TRAP-type C4-dicarboxylate transport system permease small subunit